MPSLRRLSSVASLSALLALGACDDSDSPLYPVEPIELSGEYVLRAVEGQALPLLVIDGEDLEIRLLADTLRLDAEGEGMWTTHFEWRLDEDPFQPFVTEIPVTYRFDGARLLLQQRPACPPEVECELPAEVEVTPTPAELRLTARFGAHQFERLQ